MIEWSDRYGGKHPDPATVCKGPCEGMGIYPKKLPSGEWRFLFCRRCKGTGKEPAP